MTPKITHYCTIKDHKVSLNGEELFAFDPDLNFLEFIKAAYKHFEIDYRKFYKMDPLCKLSVVVSHVLLENQKENLDENTAIILSNQSSCIDIDLKHQNNIDKEENGARPADFVYTLPNIALGELSIKYGLRSENSFFIFDHFNPEFLVSYAKSLFNLQKTKAVLGGWVEVNQENYNGFLFLAEPQKGLDFTSNNLSKLMKG